MSTPELRALEDLCARFDRAGIAYMLTGSLAMSYYARPRMTRDIDVVVALEEAAAGTLADVLGKDCGGRATSFICQPWSRST